MCDDIVYIQAALKHGGHLVPGLPYFTSVDTADGQAVENNLFPVDTGICFLQAQKSDFAAVLHIVNHVVEARLASGHLQSYIKALFHADLFHDIRQVLF